MRQLELLSLRSIRKFAKTGFFSLAKLRRTVKSKFSKTFNIFFYNLAIFSPSLSQPSRISLSVTASKSYFFCVKTMPLADSDSDTDWNAQVKILPVRSSSSPSLLHSPHNTSYAQNLSQKNFNSKTDHCTRKNTQKPQLRSLRSVLRSINNSVSRNLFSPPQIGKSHKSTTDNNYGSTNRIHHGSHVVIDWLYSKNANKITINNNNAKQYSK
ncbi:hypothetical protein P9112_001513 [Eukaryota sp. TZLM1-RC]